MATVEQTVTNRSWLADQLLGPTKLIFAIVIAGSLRDYSDVLTSPIRHYHYIVSLALLGVYLTAVWSWRGWHTAHMTTPYKVDADGKLGTSEVYRFYTDLAIVIAYAYTLFQVAPLPDDPRHDAFWLLVGYPIIIGLYLVENRLCVHAYGGSESRTILLAVTLSFYLLVLAAYLVARRHLVHASDVRDDLLWLNGVAFTVALSVMWGYRRVNVWYGERTN